MRFFLVISTLLVIGCRNQSADFKRYSKQLEQLPIPLVVKTIEYPERKVSGNFDSALFEKYKLYEAQAPYGKIYDDASTTGIIYTVSGDVGVPVLVMYDKAGRKVDSLNLFQNASGFGLESEVYERVTFLSNKAIQVIDSTVKWELNKAGDDRVEGSEKVRIDSFYYVVDRNGKIRKPVKKQR
jgi:hypothetical protein